MTSKSVPATTSRIITTRNHCRKPEGNDAPATANGLTLDMELSFLLGPRIRILRCVRHRPGVLAATKGRRATPQCDTCTAARPIEVVYPPISHESYCGAQ